MSGHTNSLHCLQAFSFRIGGTGETSTADFGAFPSHYWCQQQRLNIDSADVKRLDQSVKDRLRAHSIRRIAFECKEEQLKLQHKLLEMDNKFDELRRLFEVFRTNSVQNIKLRLEAVQTCINECSDIQSYDREVQEAFGSGDLLLVSDLALGMQAHVGEIEAAFSRTARLQEEGREIEEDVELRMEKLRRMLSKEGAVKLDHRAIARSHANNFDTLRATESGTIAAASGTIVKHSELKLEGRPTWITTCSDTIRYRSNLAGCVVHASSLEDGNASLALPEPCLVAKISGEDHLTVLSLDGSIRLISHCEGIDWNNIKGLYGDGHLVYVAQVVALTVMDLSGRTVRQILPDAAGFDSVMGVSGNAASVFVSSGNKIAAFSKETGLLETVITLQQIPHADLRSLATCENCVLAVDWKHNQVHRVCLDTEQVVATHPTRLTGLARFEKPLGVAVDSRGRMFVSEHWGQTVRAVSADDGSLLWMLGVPNESGSGACSLCGPYGLTVVSGGPCELLVAADFYTQRFVMLNLH